MNVRLRQEGSWIVTGPLLPLRLYLALSLSLSHAFEYYYGNCAIRPL